MSLLWNDLIKDRTNLIILNDCKNVLNLASRSQHLMIICDCVFWTLYFDTGAFPGFPDCFSINYIPHALLVSSWDILHVIVFDIYQTHNMDGKFFDPLSSRDQDLFEKSWQQYNHQYSDHSCIFKLKIHVLPFLRPGHHVAKSSPFKDDLGLSVPDSDCET